MSKPLLNVLTVVATTVLLSAQGFTEEAETAFILARTDVPNSIIPQAEVRLVRRGEEMIVQSVLLPRFPNKVRNKISSSEKENWPGNTDADAYMAALEDAFLEYSNVHDSKTTALIIDFVSSANSTRVDFTFAAAARGKQGITIQPAPVWRSLDLSDGYIMKNQEYILMDAFGKQADALIKTLRTSSSEEASDES
jgi:hypothetical protein